MLAVTERHKRIKAIMVQALGRNAADRFACWKRFTSVSKKVGYGRPYVPPCPTVLRVAKTIFCWQCSCVGHAATLNSSHCEGGNNVSRRAHPIEEHSESLWPSFAPSAVTPVGRTEADRSHGTECLSATCGESLSYC